LSETRRISPDFDKRVVVGYHGTSIQQAELAVGNESLLLSDDPGDWLARGAYFWENSLDMAQRWAEDKHGKNAAVVRAEIRLGRCLDLADSKWSDAIRAAYQQVEKECKERGIVLPKNVGYRHYRDYEVINLLCEKMFSVDTVRAAFREGRELYEGGFGELSHVQVAVRNPEMILSLERSYPSPFKAYLASALTNLTIAERTELDETQDMIRAVCKSRGIDIYLPKEKTDPNLHRDVPAEQVFFADIEEVLKSDLLILMTDHPSFGGGMELKAALDALLPIILIGRQEVPVSRMVRGIPSSRSYQAKYRRDEDPRIELERAISFLKQNMVDRKDSLKTREFAVGSGLKKNRERLGLSREDLAAALGTSVEAISHVEESPDYLTNPSLILLRKLAQTLETSVSEIADPTYLETVTAQALELFSENELLLKGRHSKGDISAGELNRIAVIALREKLRKVRREHTSA